MGSIPVANPSPPEHLRFPRREIAIGLAVASAVVLAACGGDSNGGEKLSVEEYFEAQKDLRADIQNRFEEGGESQTLGDFAGVFNEWIERLNNLSPPEELQREHNDLIAAVTAYREGVDRYAGGVGRDRPAGELFNDTVLVEEGLRLNDASCALQLIADDRGIETDVGCPEPDPRPEAFMAGRVEEFAVASPQYIEEWNFWLIHQESGTFTALENIGNVSRCPIEWRPDEEFIDVTGWFVDTCDGTHYDLRGDCFETRFCYGPAFFPVTVSGGEVVVNVRGVRGDEDPSGSGDQPVNPPQR